MKRPRWIVPALAGLLIVAAAMRASAIQPAVADSLPAPQGVLAADSVPLTPDADAYVDSFNCGDCGAQRRRSSLWRSG